MEISGGAGLRARLMALAPEITAAARKAVKESAEAVRDEARQGVRVDTGNLRDTVDITYAEGGLSAEVGWRNRKDWYASLHEHGTRRIPAKPTLGPATEAERTKLPDRIADEVRKALQ